MIDGPLIEQRPPPQEQMEWPETPALRELGAKGKQIRPIVNAVMETAAQLKPNLLSRLLSPHEKVRERYLFPPRSLKRTMTLPERNQLAILRNRLAVFGECTKALELTPREWQLVFTYMNQVTSENSSNPFRKNHGVLPLGNAQTFYGLALSVRDRWKTQVRQIVRGALIAGTLAGASWFGYKQLAGSIPAEPTPRAETVGPIETQGTIPKQPAATKRVRPSATPEATPTMNPETKLAIGWDTLRKTHGFAGIAGRVIDNNAVQNPEAFFQSLETLIRENNMLEEDGTLNYNPDQPSGIFLWTEPEDGAIRVRFDGPHTSPGFTAKTVYYDPTEGICAAVADEPLADGTWQQNEVRFDPNNPKSCFFSAETSSGRTVLILIIPTPEGPHVFSTIVNGYAAP